MSYILKDKNTDCIADMVSRVNITPADALGGIIIQQV